MATDVDVQYFSHLNGLVLGNNWGDLIRLLDKALVTGIDFTQITAASIDAQGDVSITLFAAHNAMLFQVVELSGFTPNSLNQKYRIKGVPNATQLILKPKDSITGTTISVVGNGKLAPLGYDIIFRDANDVKRVYRAKNPTAQHPFIRVDETISDGTNSYATGYAKYAMVGLLDDMAHIDDYNNPEVQQLPFDIGNISKNWKISGNGGSVIRGWSRWYWARSHEANGPSADNITLTNGNRSFTICGDADAFFHMTSLVGSDSVKTIYGIGLYKNALESHVKPWFLMCPLVTRTASDTSNGIVGVNDGTYPLTYATHPGARFVINKQTSNATANHVNANPILVDWVSGTSASKIQAVQMSALEIPFYDANGYLRGSLPHVCYAGRTASIPTVGTPSISGNSMYITDSIYSDGTPQRGCVHFYLGELE